MVNATIERVSDGSPYHTLPVPDGAKTYRNANGRQPQPDTSTSRPQTRGVKKRYPKKDGGEMGKSAPYKNSNKGHANNSEFNGSEEKSGILEQRPNKSTPKKFPRKRNPKPNSNGPVGGATHSHSASSDGNIAVNSVESAVNSGPRQANASETKAPGDTSSVGGAPAKKSRRQRRRERESQEGVAGVSEVESNGNHKSENGVSIEKNVEQTAGSIAGTEKIDGQRDNGLQKVGTAEKKSRNQRRLGREKNSQEAGLLGEVDRATSDPAVLQHVQREREGTQERRSGETQPKKQRRLETELGTEGIIDTQSANVVVSTDEAPLLVANGGTETKQTPSTLPLGQIGQQAVPLVHIIGEKPRGKEGNLSRKQRRLLRELMQQNAEAGLAFSASIAGLQVNGSTHSSVSTPSRQDESSQGGKLVTNDIDGVQPRGKDSKLSRKQRRILRDQMTHNAEASIVSATSNTEGPFHGTTDSTEQGSQMQQESTKSLEPPLIDAIRGVEPRGVDGKPSRKQRRILSEQLKQNAESSAASNASGATEPEVSHLQGIGLENAVLGSEMNSRIEHTNGRDTIAQVKASISESPQRQRTLPVHLQIDTDRADGIHLPVHVQCDPIAALHDMGLSTLSMRSDNEYETASATIGSFVNHEDVQRKKKEPTANVDSDNAKENSTLSDMVVHGKMYYSPASDPEGTVESPQDKFKSLLPFPLRCDPLSVKLVTSSRYSVDSLEKATQENGKVFILALDVPATKTNINGHGLFTGYKGVRMPPLILPMEPVSQTASALKLDPMSVGLMVRSSVPEAAEEFACYSADDSKNQELAVPAVAILEVAEEDPAVPALGDKNVDARPSSVSVARAVPINEVDTSHPTRLEGDPFLIDLLIGWGPISDLLRGASLEPSRITT